MSNVTTQSNGCQTQPALTRRETVTGLGVINLNPAIFFWAVSDERSTIGILPDANWVFIYVRMIKTAIKLPQKLSFPQ